jgi:hypothetical protein
VHQSGQSGEKSVVSLIRFSTHVKWQQGGSAMEAEDRGGHGMKMDRSAVKE